MKGGWCCVWVIVRSIDSYEVYHVKSDKSAESQHAAVWPTQEGPATQTRPSGAGEKIRPGEYFRYLNVNLHNSET